MLAAYLTWHLRKSVGPVDLHRRNTHPQRDNPVAPAHRSNRGQHQSLPKKNHHRHPPGPPHSYQGTASPHLEHPSPATKSTSPAPTNTVPMLAEATRTPNSEHSKLLGRHHHPHPQVAKTNHPTNNETPSSTRGSSFSGAATSGLDPGETHLLPVARLKTGSVPRPACSGVRTARTSLPGVLAAEEREQDIREVADVPGDDVPRRELNSPLRSPLSRAGQRLRRSGRHSRRSRNPSSTLAPTEPAACSSPVRLPGLRWRCTAKTAAAQHDTDRHGAEASPAARFECVAHPTLSKNTSMPLGAWAFSLRAQIAGFVIDGGVETELLRTSQRHFSPGPPGDSDRPGNP